MVSPVSAGSERMGLGSPAQGADAKQGLSAMDDQLPATIDTEHHPGAPRGGVVALAAQLGRNARVHNAATLWAVADRRVDAPMIHVIARIEPHRSSHHSPRSAGVRPPIRCL